jgi:predicted acylesterase/phospholipase RssA
LALGGGGAKGAAHIGVLRVLEQHNIPIDYIACTSIGSVVGGLYATGLTVDEIEKILLETPWEDGYSDRIPREDLPWKAKQQGDQFNIPLEIGVQNDQLKIPSGLLYGQEATSLLREALGEYPSFESFDDLAIPYRATATDLANYKAVIINKGRLISAMRASSSIPGVLAPEEIDGLLLVDGGNTKNLPVDVVRTMGADIIIAVDIGTELLPKEALGSTFAVMGQMSFFLTNGNTLVQRGLLSKDDVLIKPNINGLSTTDWSNTEEAIIRGQAAANQQRQQLERLSLDDEAYRAHLALIQSGRSRFLVPIDQQYHSISQGLGYNFIQQGFTELGITSDVGTFSDPILLKGTINYFTFSAFLRKEEVDDHPVITKKEGVSQIMSLVIDVNWKGALKFGHHAIVAKASYSEAFTEGDNESVYISYLGGFLKLSGYSKDALAGAKKCLVAGIYQFDLGRSLLNLEQFPLYLGFSLEAGNVWQQDEQAEHDQLIFSGSTYLGTGTSLGPIALGYGKTNTNKQAFYFYLGKSF